MSGWKLKEGPITTEWMSDIEYWSLFNSVFSSSCRKTNSYKFGLIKSICDQIYDLEESQYGYSITYEKVFERFAENYWNLVITYKIKQMIFNGKSRYSKIENILLEAEALYGVPSGTQFEVLTERDRRKLVKRITSECQKYVIGALYNDFEGKIYSFSCKNQRLILSSGAYNFIAKHKNAIEKLNYYHWAKFLESINEDEAASKLLSKLELATPRRSDLSVYRNALCFSFDAHTCFYCGKELSQRGHVDHFIPWSFIKTDNLWNMVMSCSKCNLKKNNKLMNKNYTIMIEERNNSINDSREKTLFILEEFRGYKPGLIDRIWLYAKESGYREYVD